MNDTAKSPPPAWLAPLLLLLAGLVLNAAWFTRPLSVVFDEVYFGRYAMAYLKGHDYFDLHPPLAKLLLGATAWVLGLDPGFSWATNGLAFPDASYALLRVPVHVVGILLPLAFWGVARELGLSRWAAFVVGALAVLDNAWLVMTRIALTDDHGGLLQFLVGHAPLLPKHCVRGVCRWCTRTWTMPTTGSPWLWSLTMPLPSSNPRAW